MSKKKIQLRPLKAIVALQGTDVQQRLGLFRLGRNTPAILLQAQC